MRSTNRPPPPEQVAEICERWSRRETNPTTLNDLAREFRRCDRTIKRVLVENGYSVEIRRYAPRGLAPKPKLEVSDALDHARNCDTNARIRAIMEKHHASIRP